ncbi:hypothetical protein VTN77DRAFT_7591 [Rasamsonia byssochlamydoides]|uniref:uncharacterized protein n=1 Tax=Rasamsonia byssochlamydoides TaxID=89139 RepID=UPI003742D46D
MSRGLVHASHSAVARPVHSGLLFVISPSRSRECAAQIRHIIIAPGSRFFVLPLFTNLIQFPPFLSL